MEQNNENILIDENVDKKRKRSEASSTSELDNSVDKDNSAPKKGKKKKSKKMSSITE